MLKIIHGLFVIFILLLFFQELRTNTSSINSQNYSEHLALGLPIDKDTSDDFIIIRKQYVTSYNKNLNVPNWTCWHLTINDFGGFHRYTGNFITDTTLPSTFYKVKDSDFNNSGYDRGHLVRSEERTDSKENNISTFILTNIIPQIPSLNRYAWKSFEYECERLCRNENRDLYIIAGGVYSKKSKKIRNIITVPDSCWKIVIVLDKGQSIKNINYTTDVKSVMMANTIYLPENSNWKLYKTTIKNIEKRTGYKLLLNIPKKIRDSLKLKK